MMVNWAHAWPAATAAFLASLVEFVEALTVVLAVGTVRGWRGALVGAGSAVAVLLLAVVLFGPLLTRIPIATVQLAVGTLLLLFGMRWLRKAILRAAGIIPLHDEEGTFAKESAFLRSLSGGGRWDKVGIATAFKITLLEGLEVVFIVVAVGAGGSGLLIPASLGALAAMLLVVILGVLVHRPLAAIPENALKFIVGVLLSAFGVFWTGEGMDIAWPGKDWSIAGLVAGFLLVSLLAIRLCRRGAPAQS